MQTEEGAIAKANPTPVRRRAGMVLSYAVAIGCLYWVFHDIPFGELVRAIARINWWWVLPAVVLDLLVYVCAAWEWQLLLRPAGHLSLRQTVQAVFAGRFANDVLPVHAGYVIRLYLASRWMGRSIAAVVPSLLIERLFDSLWLALGIGLTTLFFPLPADLARAGEVLGGFILAGVVVVAWTILRKKKEGARTLRPHAPGQMIHADAPSALQRFSRLKVVRKIQASARTMSDGLRSIGRSYLMLTALGLSILKLVLQALAFLSVLEAFDFSFSIWIKLAVFLIAYIGISMPSTPASIGVFQLFCMAGLRFFAVPKPVAGSFALVAYVALTAPLSLAGVWAVMRSGLTWRQMREEIRRWRE